MAGVLVSLQGQQWVAASWLFEWLLKALATQVDDPELAEELREVVEENLGWFSLLDLTKDQREKVVDIIQNGIIPIAESDLPPELPNREEVLQHIQSLVRSVF